MLPVRTGKALVRHRHPVLIGLAALALGSCSSAHMAPPGVSNAPFLGCVSSPQDGAMGIHYVNGDLVGDGKLDAARPEARMYEQKGNKLELVGV